MLNTQIYPREWYALVLRTVHPTLTVDRSTAQGFAQHSSALPHGLTLRGHGEEVAMSVATNFGPSSVHIMRTAGGVAGVCTHQHISTHLKPTS